MTTGETGAFPDEASLVIRRAVADDAPALERLYRELVADPLICVLPEQVATLADSSGCFLFVAESAGIVCGTALLNLCPDAMYQWQPFAVLENIVVSPAARGKGIGRALLEHAEALAAARDCSKLMLSSGVARTEAHAFFHRCGFSSDTKHAFVKYRRQFGFP